MAMASPDPEKCQRALEGAIDKYVKQRARNTIALNAERDPACAGYARIPGPDACDFCVTMGAANDFYHTKDSAGGGSGHGTADDHYHPYCNCQVCMVFRKGGKPGGDLVARDPETGEVVPYDPADMLRRYDEAGHPTFPKAGARSGSGKPGGSGKPAVLSEKEFDAAIQQLSEASTVEELHAAGERVVSMWRAGKAGRDEAQWRRMSRFAQNREKELRGKSVAVEGGSSSASATTRVVNPASEFMGKMEEREFHELIETRFGCKVTDGFRELPMSLKRPFMADLEAVYGEFPEARIGLKRIGVSGDMDAAEVIRCEPISPPGRYQLVFNKNYLCEVDSVSARYASAVADGQQIAGSSWPSLAIHDGFHGVEVYICSSRYASSRLFYEAWESGEVASEIVAKAYGKMIALEPRSPDLNSALKAISNYATKNDSEAICEAAKDVLVNGEKAQLLSRLIVGVVKEILRGLR